MHVTVYSFIKKDKSTLQPIDNNTEHVTDMECVLKDNGCGIINPVLEINYGLERAPVNYNYAWIEDFKRYYYVLDWVFIDGLWYGFLEEDYLATWKTKVLNSSAYILRSAQKYNGYVSDMLYPASTEVSVLSNQIDYPFRNGSPTLPLKDGEFVLGIQGAVPEAVGSVGFENGSMFGSTIYYVMSFATMRYFITTLMTTTDWANIDWDTAGLYITDDILKTLFNPLQYITSCTWIPGGVAADRKKATTTIKFGWWSMELAGLYVMETLIPDTLIRQIDVPKHPQSDARGQYLNMAPFADYQLHVPPYGIVPISADDLQGESAITVEWVLDYMTGSGRIMVGNSKRFIMVFNTMIGVSIPLAQISSNPWEALEGVSGFVSQTANRVSGALGSVANIALSAVGASTGGAASNAGAYSSGAGSIANLAPLPIDMVNDAIAGIGDVAGSLSPTVTTLQGSPAGTLIGVAVEDFVRLSGKFLTVVDEDNERMGRPYCKVGRIGDFRGFIKTQGAAVNIEGNRMEQSNLNTLLDSGVFIE